MSKGTYQKLTIVGRLGKDPHCIEKDGKLVAVRLSIATTDSVKSKGKEGDWEDLTTWHDVACFRNNAEFAGQYLKSGDLVLVEAKLRNAKWEDKEGNEQRSVDIVVHMLEKISTAKAKEEGAAEVVEASSEKDPLYDIV